MAADPVLLLGATALGGAISASTTYLMARRSERAAAWATARLLRDDLSMGVAMTNIALAAEKWWISDFGLATRTWQEDRAPLALFLSDAEWTILAGAFEEMRVTNDAVADIYASLPEEVERGWAAPLTPAARVRAQMTHDAALSALVVLTRFSRQPGLGARAKSAFRLARRRARIAHPPSDN